MLKCQIIGILTFMGRMNFILSLVEHEKGFVNLGQGKTQTILLNYKDRLESFNFEFRNYMSLVMRKPDFCICENKDADQLHGNRETDPRLCFGYTDSTIPLLPKSEISSL